MLLLVAFLYRFFPLFAYQDERLCWKDNYEGYMRTVPGIITPSKQVIMTLEQRLIVEDEFLSRLYWFFLLNPSTQLCKNDTSDTL